jgi:hypothetical protein
MAERYRTQAYFDRLSLPAGETDKTFYDDRVASAFASAPRASQNGRSTTSVRGANAAMSSARAR